MHLPPLHRRFLNEISSHSHDDARIVGIAASGSIANGQPDQNSDVDLVLAVEDDEFDRVLSERTSLIASWVPLVAGFTGEHVGEPRVIISIVGPPLLHVDFKFVRISDVAQRIDNLLVLWERDGRLSAALNRVPPIPLRYDFQWIEDRFWVWIHYGATKLARGEYFELIGFLAYLRETVFGPLIGHRNGTAIQGVRRIETLDPAAAHELERTLCGPDQEEAGRALFACVELYRRWISDYATEYERRHTAERLAVSFLEDTAL